jgi:hypothetical protein
MNEIAHGAVMGCHRLKFAPAKIEIVPASFERIQCNHRWTDQKALIEQRFRDLETTPQTSMPWKEAKLRLMAPFKR